MLLLSLAAFALTTASPPDSPERIGAAAFCAGVGLAATLRRSRFAAAPLVLGLTATIGLVLPVWQAVLAAALGLWALLRRRLPTLAVSQDTFARGTLPWGWTLLCAAVTPIALLTWLGWARPDLSDVVATYVPDLPLPVLAVGAVGFALVNAALEELVWRGVVQDRVAAAHGPGLAVGLQAASFGIAHWYGVPRGAIGAVLAGSWAVMLGLLRVRSGGLLAPFLAHVVADSVIAAIILTL